MRLANCTSDINSGLHRTARGHGEVASAWQHIHSLSYLLIVGSNQNAISGDAAIRGGEYVEAQLHFDEVTIVVDQRRKPLERRIVSDKIFEGFQNRVRHRKI